MAIYLSSLIDELRDYLDDDADSQVSFAAKVRYLNRGQAAMYPKIFTTVRDDSVQYESGTYEYAVPAVITAGKLLTVEIQSEAGSPRWVRFDDYEIIPSAADAATMGILVVSRDMPDRDSSYFRFTAAVPLTPFTSANYAAAGTEDYVGPAYSAQLPVFFAMSQIMARVLDKRMDFGRFSVQNQNATAGPIDIMSASQYWMDRFTQFLDQMQMPLPSTGI